jgi:hypothetical protein
MTSLATFQIEPLTAIPTPIVRAFIMAMNEVVLIPNILPTDIKRITFISIDTIDATYFCQRDTQVAFVKTDFNKIR